MTKKLLQLILIFLIISVASLFATHFLNINFGNENYWDRHGLFFLIFISMFPRLTLLFSSIASGGLIWWLGWIFAPRVLVATLATLVYWQQNPLLVAISWLIAIGGESSEKYIVVRRTQRFRQPYYGPNTGEVIDVTPFKRD